MDWLSINGLIDRLHILYEVIVRPQQIDVGALKTFLLHSNYYFYNGDCLFFSWVVILKLNHVKFRLKEHSKT